MMLSVSMQPVQVIKPDESTLRDASRKALKAMIVARTADLKFSSLYKAGKITGGCHMGKGHEAISAATAVFLRKSFDVYAPFIREQAGRTCFGEPLLEAAQTYLGSVKGPMRGRDGNVHRGNTADGIIVPISHLGAGVAVVAGRLMGKRLKGLLPGPVGIAHVGDGTTSTGAFHEALNLAAVEKLPFACVITNNQYAYSTPNDHEFACKSLVDKAIGYGMEGYEIDGTDLIASIELMYHVVENLRHGGTPALIVANVLRLCGHGEHDDAKYISQELKNSPIGRDCLPVAEQQLLEREWTSSEELKEWHKSAADDIQTAVAQAQRDPEPNPFREDWSTTVCYFEETF